MAKRTQPYSAELKEQVLREILDKSRTRASVVREYGVTESTVSRWVAQYRKTHSAGETVAETDDKDARIHELERKLREAEQERDFLKKAAAFFARDHR